MSNRPTLSPVYRFSSCSDCAGSADELPADPAPLPTDPDPFAPVVDEATVIGWHRELVHLWTLNDAMLAAGWVMIVILLGSVALWYTLDPAPPSMGVEEQD